MEYNNTENTDINKANSCVNCGKEIDYDTNFCPYCGVSISYESKEKKNKMINSFSKKKRLSFIRWTSIVIIATSIVSVIISIILGTRKSEDIESIDVIVEAEDISSSSFQKEKEAYTFGLEAYSIMKSYYYNDNLSIEENQEKTLTSMNSLYHECSDKLGTQNGLSVLLFSICNNLYKVCYSGLDERFLNNCFLILQKYFCETAREDFIGLPFISENIIVFKELENSSNTIILDLSNNGMGLYNSDSEKYIYGPTEYYLDKCSENLICVQQDGYYGCIDYEGNKIIGFYYEYPLNFINGVSSAKSNEKYGLIDTNGNEIIPTMFDEILIDNNYIRVRNLDLWGLYDYYGNIMVEPIYADIVYMDNLILARQTGKGYDTSDKYDLYDNYGNIFSKDNIQQLSGYPCSGIRYVTNLSDKIIAVTCREGNDDRFYEYYTLLINTDLELLTTQCFCEDSVSRFSSSGFATANKGELYISNTLYNTYSVARGNWVVINNKGEIICDLPELGLGAASNYYNGANEYYAYGCGTTGGQPDRYSIVNLKTQNIIEYDSVELIDGTNCIIVSDTDTGLYGLYDGDSLVFEVLYNEIYRQEDGSFVAIRGAEEATYLPVKILEESEKTTDKSKMNDNDKKNIIHDNMIETTPYVIKQQARFPILFAIQSYTADEILLTSATQTAIFLSCYDYENGQANVVYINSDIAQYDFHAEDFRQLGDLGGYKGITGLLYTINENYSFKCNNCILTNFSLFGDYADMVGGVKMDITLSESDWEQIQQAYKNFLPTEKERLDKLSALLEKIENNELLYYDDFDTLSSICRSDFYITDETKRKIAEGLFGLLLKILGSNDYERYDEYGIYQDFWTANFSMEELREITSKMKENYVLNQSRSSGEWYFYKKHPDNYIIVDDYIGHVRDVQYLLYGTSDYSISSDVLQVNDKLNEAKNNMEDWEKGKKW